VSALGIKALHAGYGVSTVLRGLDLDVDEGESVALVGRNGAGKSTLLMSVFRETNIFSGEIWVRDTRIDRLPGYAAAKLGVSISPQGRRILPNLTVRENLLLGRATGRAGRWTLRTVYDLFPVLAERANSAGTMLSGGQQQMLAIGRALMANPALLLLDEPSEGLSPVLVDDLARALNEIRSAGTGALVVEQHLSLVRRTTSRFVILSKGQIVGAGPISEMGSRENQALMAL
jgi:ABC-type branched-subunit amino acid transport system ATPase component